MKTFKIAAAIVAASTSAFTIAPAFAQTSESGSQGHYEWRAQPQVGPRAPLQAPRRVWVSDAPQVADGDCDMMETRRADCMKKMHGITSPSSAQRG